MAVGLLTIGGDAPYVDSNGDPLSAGKIYFYVAGSSTPQDTYTTSLGNVANANPVVLGSGGYPSSAGSVVQIWGTVGVSYKAILKNAAGTTIWTRDNLPVINDVSAAVTEWISGPAPTYIGATSFSLVGDQTSTFQVGRRVKTTNSGGTIYSTISASAYGALTTVTVVNDSGTLDSGLSAVSYGIITTTNTSFILRGAAASLSFAPITNSLSGDVALNNTANFFTGPTIAQGTSGTWFVSGTVTVIDTAGAATFHAKLWDGTTVVASAALYVSAANVSGAIAISGYISSPAGNLRISVKDITSTSGAIQSDAGSMTKSSTLSAIRIA